MGRKKTGVTLDCPICNKAFYIPASQAARKPVHTCSAECGFALIARQRVHRVCVECGKPFTMNEQRAKVTAGLYCSNACNGKAMVSRAVVQCAWCKSDLERVAYKIKKQKRHFCDLTCTHEWKQRYGTDRGRGAFTAKQKRDWMEPCCKRCGITEDLQLDHIIPKFAGGSNTKDNAQTLCRKCNREKFWLEDQYKFSPDRPHSARVDVLV